jgi:hypothetical protein
MAEVNKYFLKYKKQLIKKLGSKGLYDDTIDDNCERLFKSKWKGCVSHNKMSQSNGYQILNTASSKSHDGIHWVAVYITPTTIYVYDSYGRDSDSILKSLNKNKKKRKIVESDRDPEQFGDSEICGHLCISWLLCVNKFGIRKALQI